MARRGETKSETRDEVLARALDSAEKAYDEALTTAWRAYDAALASAEKAWAEDQ